MNNDEVITNAERLPPEQPQLSIGMLPLSDAAPLVVAVHNGFFEREGLEVTLSVEASWANIRDKMQLGSLDAAQMLALMPLASSLGLDGRKTAILSAMTLNLNGNAITVSNDVYQQMLALAPTQAHDSTTTAAALSQIIKARQQQGLEPLRFATVYTFSSHRYLLRYWLASAGIDPDRDLDLRVVPPPQMAAQLEAGQIDGYCVGDPWNTMAAKRTSGVVLASSENIWQNGQEKVLGVREEWVKTHPDTHRALLRALIQACAWLDADIEHRRIAASLLVDGGYLDVPPHIVEETLVANGLEHGVLFHRYSANFPWRSHTLWFATQMARWGHIKDTAIVHDAVLRCTRPDLYRQAADDLGLASPDEDMKSEGTHAAPWTLPTTKGDLFMGPDLFLDGAQFDPYHLEEHLPSQRS
ncbi:CmpA/NrtA family ABC transporter substrate-binding protein [Phytohalomonas tamaricis]|uniref:CmpA/NrtA family ABC transporter substrate-binding protein n=1 Tax=Phytohalomonas tamaricis TaxID=2081032 RepID=UPI000D0B66B8|nr:CmpA/NrtA family ABC transporter substrate-binding protein [Phytohalomonas tamaricis]